MGGVVWPRGVGAPRRRDEIGRGGLGGSRVDNLQVRRVVIVTLEQASVVRAGADHRHTAQACREREHSVVLQHDHGLGSRPVRQRPLGGGLEGGRRRLLVYVGLLEEAKAHLETQHTAHRRVDNLQRHPAGLNLGLEWRAVALLGRQFDVQAGAQSQTGGLRWVRGDVVLLHELWDGPVVRDDHAVEAQFAA